MPFPVAMSLFEYHKLSKKLTFSEKQLIFFSGKVHSDVDVSHCSRAYVILSAIFVTLASEFFRPNFQQGSSGFEISLILKLQ